MPLTVALAGEVLTSLPSLVTMAHSLFTTRWGQVGQRPGPADNPRRRRLFLGLPSLGDPMRSAIARVKSAHSPTFDCRSPSHRKPFSFRRSVASKGCRPIPSRMTGGVFPRYRGLRFTSSWPRPEHRYCVRPLGDGPEATSEDFGQPLWVSCRVSRLATRAQLLGCVLGSIRV